MNVCIVFNSEYSKPEASVSRTMGWDVQQAVYLSVYGQSGATKRAKRTLAPSPFFQVT